MLHGKKVYLIFLQLIHFYQIAHAFKQATFDDIWIKQTVANYATYCQTKEHFSNFLLDTIYKADFSVKDIEQSLLVDAMQACIEHQVDRNFNNLTRVYEVKCGKRLSRYENKALRAQLKEKVDFETPSGQNVQILTQAKAEIIQEAYRGIDAFNNQWTAFRYIHSFWKLIRSTPFNAGYVNAYKRFMLVSK